MCRRRKGLSGSKLAYVTYGGEVFPCASTKNNNFYMVGSLDETEKLKNILQIQKV